MKGIARLVIALIVLAGSGTEGRAVEFTAQGDWLFGLGAVNSTFVTKTGGKKTQASADDKFAAMQRLRLQFEAVISESITGALGLEIGDTSWGSARAYTGGGALGADGNIIKIRRAYLDWAVPNADLRFRMGLQSFATPFVAGGSSILNAEVAALVANYKFNDAVGLTAAWLRPYNDNYINTQGTSGNPSNFLDNVDFFLLSLPLTGKGWSLTPWAMFGAAGEMYHQGNEQEFNMRGGDFFVGTMPYTYVRGLMNGNVGANPLKGPAYSKSFFAGLPLSLTTLDPLRIEVDINYGYFEGLGRYDITDYRDHVQQRADTRREGWLVKALVEYKMDWGTPGLLGWYASGDDGNIKNGSERMPAISPCGSFTSFIGDDPKGNGLLLSGKNQTYDLQMTYAGTWGLGLQIRDVSFMPDLAHSLRIVHWGGTNSPAMVKYLAPSDFGDSSPRYLTTQDSMLEFNLDSEYRIYENLEFILQLGYIVNNVDTGLWNRSYRGDQDLQKGDAYKVAAVFKYSF